MVNAQYSIHELQDKIKVLQLLSKISENPIEVKQFKLEIVNLKSQINCIKYIQLTY